MTPKEERVLEAWKRWLLEAVQKKFQDRKMSMQMLVEARQYLLDLIDLTFENDQNYDAWKSKLDVEVGMDEETERPYYRIVWNGEKE
jgi:hypothetical protein